ncbi:VOC family protein [Erwinia rhapontici]|uniref:VOC family protein n=1 Tax=Erwinia rhapontici TaxID=55212 RepID=UPI003BA019AD
MNFTHLHLARPVSNLDLSCEMYCRGIELNKLGSFSDHEGFSGHMLGRDGLGWHLEFTQCHHHPVSPSPSDDDLLVLYVPDKALWDDACSRMERAGFTKVSSFNPYWDNDGVTFQDHDGYRVVIQNRQWV